MGIVIDRLIIKNFQSYGDYITELPIGSMGPTLIVGRLNGQAGKSNGVGKTTITNAILWCLFGRLFDIKQPGDGIINRQSGANCLVRIITRDGWVITRTRKMEGSDDLLVYYGQEDKTRSTNTEAQKFIIRHFGLDYDIFISSVFFGQFSKPFLEMGDPQRKAALERLLNVHRLNAWADVAKEKLGAAESEHGLLKVESETIQNSILHANSQIAVNQDRLNSYEIDRKVQAKSLTDEIAAITAKVSNWKTTELPSLQDMQRKWDLLRQLRVKYDEHADELNSTTGLINETDLKIRTLEAGLQSAKKRIVDFSTIDFAALRAEHDAYNNAKSKKSKLADMVNGLKLKLRAVQQDLERAKTAIAEWNNKSGAVCITCKQIIDPAHVKNICAPASSDVPRLEEEKATYTGMIAIEEDNYRKMVVNEPSKSIAEISRLESELAVVKKTIADGDSNIKVLSGQLRELRAAELVIRATKDKIALVMNQQKPPYVPDEINAKIKIMNDEAARAIRLQKELDTKLQQPNPYSIVINDLNESLIKLNDRKNKISEEMAILYNKTVHYNYLYKAYSDRKKIKSVILGELIPFLNKRILYYLGIFECPIKIGFIPSLGVESNKWKYNLCSGGQRRRIDLAIAFALHDLHLAIYGRQCNIILFDEVDSRLDSAGAEAFTSLILDDISSSHGGKPGPDSVLVVSHKDEMRDVFPASIVVNMKKDNIDNEDEDGLSYAEYVTNQ